MKMPIGPAVTVFASIQNGHQSPLNKASSKSLKIDLLLNLSLFYINWEVLGWLVVKTQNFWSGPISVLSPLWTVLAWYLYCSTFRYWYWC